METTDLEILRRLRFYLRLSYPVSITCDGLSFRGQFPDLPGCHAQADCVRELHGKLELERRSWIQRNVMAGAQVPMPNSHLHNRRQPKRLRRRRRAQLLPMVMEPAASNA